ncbi:MAG: TonB-dependent receptor, partial [Bacteroidota bacterium]
MRTLARFLPLLVLLAGLPATALADGFPAEASSLYGKIAGTVTDAASGEPLPGVNIFLVDSDGQGTATDLDGNYTILQVRPGTYSVRFTFIGFANQVVENVQVEVDRTTRIDVQLSEEVFEGQEVVVTAERGLVQVDRTTTTATVSGEELEALPVNSINDAISLQAGVVDGRFRGGRSGEVAFLVNGVPINNAFNNQAAFEVEQNMVSSLEVISGVFNAEYGQALSGVVSIVTKDLPDSWSGSFQGFAGALASTRELEFVDRSVGPGLTGADSFTSEELSYFEVAPLTNLIDLQASIGGPIIRDKLGIQLTGRYLNNDSHLFGRDLFNPADSSVGLNTGTDPANWIVESTGSGDFVSLSESERWSLNGTLSYQLSTNVKLDYNVFLQDGNGMPCWGRGGCHDQKYVPDGINRDRFNSQTHILGVRYTLGTKSFGNVSYSYLRDKYDSFLYESPFDERYQTPQLQSLDGASAFDVGGNDLFNNDFLTETHTIVADFSSQLNQVHLAKVGILARLHRLDNFSFGIEKSARTGNQPQPSPDRFAD